MNYYALVKNEVVQNVIVADAAFVARITAQYDAVVDVTSVVPRPCPCWTYDGTNFFAPVDLGSDEGN